MKFISSLNFWSKGLSNIINTIHKNTISTSWFWSSHYRKGHQHQKVSDDTPLTSVRLLLEGRSSFLVLGDAPRGNFTHRHTPPPPERLPMLWGTTPADSIKAKGVVFNLSLAKEFCIWPTSRLYIVPVSSGLLQHCHHFLLHMLGHSQTSLIRMRSTLCYPSIGYMFTSLFIKLCSLLWALRCSAKSILNTYRLAVSRWAPAPAVNELQLSERQLGQHILAQEMGSSLRSLKQWRTGSTKASSIKNVIHCVPVIKRLCPGVSWKVFN